MEIKKLKSLKTRIIKANNSFSVMGDMILGFELDKMSDENLKILSNYLVEQKISYDYLDKIISKKSLEAKC